MPKHMHLSAFTQASICHHSKGQWKHPLDRSSNGYRNINYWVELARTLERGCFDNVFFADVHGTYDVFKGSRETGVKHAVQIPGIDPTVIIPAMAHATTHLGFACTYSTTYFPPYHTAKLFSTLDHLSNGRVAWNIVTSYLNDANKNFGLGEMLPHDQRYDRADEYMDVVYKLWEHSWEEDAIVRDMQADIHTDPTKVHEINHVGEYFDVPGPHQCEPSPQRTPVLFQAGASGRGSEFAAEHAEAIFVIGPTVDAVKGTVKKNREAMAEKGRKPEEIKLMQGVAVIVAPTDEEARLKEQTCRHYATPEGTLALVSGWAGIDLSELEPGKPLDEYESNAIQGILKMFLAIDPDRTWTLEEIGKAVEIGSIFPKIVGSPATVADELERWMDETDIDGFNVHAVNQPTGFEDFVNLVVPELQRRDRLRSSYEGSTLRENFFGEGHKRLPENHAAFRALPPWRQA